MPLKALAQDNWIGREPVHVCGASKATKMLVSLGRCCWKEVRLGKGAPDVQHKGITGNTIRFAQPTADISSMEPPPAQDALLGSLNVVFSGKPHDLRKAHWATIKRAEYMQRAQVGTSSTLPVPVTPVCHSRYRPRFFAVLLSLQGVAPRYAGRAHDCRRQQVELRGASQPATHGRTTQSSDGLFMSDSLQTARLILTLQTVGLEWSGKHFRVLGGPRGSDYLLPSH